jgi:hypothetical protein
VVRAENDQEIKAEEEEPVTWVYGFAHESGVTLGGHEQFSLDDNTVNGEEILHQPRVKSVTFSRMWKFP